MGMSDHTLKLTDIEIITVREALLAFKMVGDDQKVDSYIDSVLAKIGASWTKKNEREKTVKIKRSREDLAREALIAHIEDELFNPASRTEAAKSWRASWKTYDEPFMAKLKASMLKDAKAFPKPTEEEWEWDEHETIGCWYSGRVAGLPCEISFDKAITKVTNVYVEID